ncbi:uncharacterized protein LOC128987645 [Macrosteles quadrilineatus]|uniref:uncharacterized protein LOC128987645 n=1 Tax=Macrosteles quadrilineatus TaxID=74068 RepID=UPI0023E26A5A|nr:uncharacterized protein LOC128987645 [Macrosteles quadrilineatus]
MVVFIAFVVCSFVSTALACNGYEARNLKVEMCGDKNGLIQFDNVVPDLRDDCTVVVKGCIKVTKQIDWGNGTYKIEKKGMPPIKFQGKEDLCKLFKDSKKNPEVSLVFKMLNLEQKCPLKAGEICGDPKGVSVAKYKDHMKMMAGDYEGIIQGVSNNGPVCVKVTVSIVAKGGAGGLKGLPKMG